MAGSPMRDLQRSRNYAVRGERGLEISFVTAPARPPTPLLEDYPYRLSDNVRFADLDPNQHVNNAVYASYFETSRVLLMRDPECGLVWPGQSWVLAQLNINFRAELHWPGKIELGLGVTRIGRSSVTYAQVVFSEGKCIASATATTVMVGLQSRQPTPIPAELSERFQPWMMRGEQSI
jgi:acyl-CoA thioester hydrolase